MCWHVILPGPNLKDHINSDAVHILKGHYGIDMEAMQRPKLLEALPPIDIVIMMGCDVHCPSLTASYREDWELKNIEVVKIIRTNVLDLKVRMISGESPCE